MTARHSKTVSSVGGYGQGLLILCISDSVYDHDFFLPSNKGALLVKPLILHSMCL